MSYVASHCVRAVEFAASPANPEAVGGVRSVRVHLKQNSVAVEKPTFVEVKGTDRLYPADIVILALDGATVNEQVFAMGEIRIGLTSDGLLAAKPGEYATSTKGVFACGDCRA